MFGFEKNGYSLAAGRVHGLDQHREGKIPPGKILLHFFHGSISSGQRCMESVFPEESAELVLIAQDFHRIQRVAGQSHFLSHKGGSGGGRVRSIRQYTLRLLLAGHFQHGLPVGGADRIKLVSGILTGVVRQVIAENGIVSQLFCLFYGNDLLGGATQQQKLFHGAGLLFICVLFPSWTLWQRADIHNFPTCTAWSPAHTGELPKAPE